MGSQGHPRVHRETSSVSDQVPVLGRWSLNGVTWHVFLGTWPRWLRATAAAPCSRGAVFPWGRVTASAVAFAPDLSGKVPFCTWVCLCAVGCAPAGAQPACGLSPCPPPFPGADCSALLLPGLSILLAGWQLNSQPGVVSEPVL